VAYSPLLGYLPVSMLKREGEHMELAEYALEKVAPSSLSF
jgi:hypothetical protein